MEHKTVLYPVLVGEMAKRRITQSDLAKCTGLTPRSINRRMNGLTDFTWPDAQRIHQEYFPSIPISELFARSN